MNFIQALVDTLSFFWYHVRNYFDKGITYGYRDKKCI